MTPRKRPVLLHVIDSLGRSGGAEQQLVNNLHRFSSDTISHRILCLYDAGEGSRVHELPTGVGVTYLLPAGARTRNRATLIKLVYAAVRSERPDVLHCALPDAALATRVAGRLLGIPIVETLVNVSHDPVRLVDSDSVRPWKLAAHRLIDRVTMRWVTRFQALSGAVADSWISNVGIDPHDIDLIPRGVEVSPIPDDRGGVIEELGLSPDSFIILNIGRQVAQKGQIYLIRAMPAILDAVPNAVLVTVGSRGPATEGLDAEAERLGIESNVRWLGVRRDVGRLLGAADVFVFPSLFEGLGVSLLEAMAAGLACVTTDRGPMNEVVEDGRTGLLVPAGDPSALSRTVIRLAQDPSLRGSLGSQARDHVAENFELDEIANRVERLYLDVVRSRAADDRPGRDHW
jgi:glycosyltransferase involved in cell wall biosynthesis